MSHLQSNSTKPANGSATAVATLRTIETHTYTRFPQQQIKVTPDLDAQRIYPIHLQVLPKGLMSQGEPFAQISFSLTLAESEKLIRELQLANFSIARAAATAHDARTVQGGDPQYVPLYAAETLE